MGFLDRLIKKTRDGVENRVSYDLSRSIADGVEQAIHNAGRNISNAAQNPGSWKCEGCNTENKSTTKFCTNCGLEKGTKKVFFKCNNCGYEHTDPNTSPKFCPECGSAVDSTNE